jgi:hypothetical protein
MPRPALIGADSAAAVREILIVCCGRIACDAADPDRAELVHRNPELQQQIRDFRQLPRCEPGASLALNISGPMDGSSSVKGFHDMAGIE